MKGILPTRIFCGPSFHLRMVVVTAAKPRPFLDYALRRSAFFFFLSRFWNFDLEWRSFFFGSFGNAPLWSMVVLCFAALNGTAPCSNDLSPCTPSTKLGLSSCQAATPVFLGFFRSPPTQYTLQFQLSVKGFCAATLILGARSSMCLNWYRPFDIFLP